MNRTFKAAVAALMLAVGFAGSVAAGPFEDAAAADAAYAKGDYATALRLMRPLAEQGDATAQFLPRANRTTDGQGVPQDYAAAASWYRKAAEQGDAGAQVFLGALYYRGEGVPRDYVLAHMWLNLAAARSGAMLNFLMEGFGLPKPAEFRDMMAARMTPAAQVAEAQKLAREWKPK